MLAIVINLLKIHAMKVLLSLIVTAILFIRPDKIQSAHTLRSSYSSIDWEKTKEWRLYFIRSKDAFTYPIDTLKAFRSIPLQQDTMLLFLKNVTQLPEGKNPVWMGAYVSSCQLADGAHIKIEISQYGSFFYVERDSCYYQLRDEVRDSWLPYLTAKWLQLKGVN